MNRALFYLLSFTWGALSTFPGLLYALILRLCGFRPKRFGFCLRFEVGNRRWGGVSFGCVIITCREPSLHLLQHEHGHGIQNIILGPLMLPLVSLPSTLRYHTRNIISRFRPGTRLRPYDSIWFEGWATALGEKYFPGEN